MLHALTAPDTDLDLDEVLDDTLSQPQTEDPFADDGNRTNGLEDVVDWPELERGLDEGRYTYKSDMKNAVRAMFEEAGQTMTNQTYRKHVLGGLFPMYRAMYADLPNPPGTPKTIITDEMRAAVFAGRERGVTREMALEHLGITQRAYDLIVLEDREKKGLPAPSKFKRVTPEQRAAVAAARSRGLSIVDTAKHVGLGRVITKRIIKELAEQGQEQAVAA